MRKIISFIVLMLWFWAVSSQYVFFDTWFYNNDSSKTYPYQQWCVEHLPINGYVPEQAFSYKIYLDLSSKMIYNEWTRSTILSSDFIKWTMFPDLPSESSLSINGTEFFVEPTNSNYAINTWWIWTINFIPEFDNNDYNFVVKVDEKTQYSNKSSVYKNITMYNIFTWFVRKEPCTPDEQDPQISNLKVWSISINQNWETTKVSNNWSMTLGLSDDRFGKKEWTWEIPYIYDSNNERTWHNNTSMTNQYWVNPDKFELHVSWNWQSKVLKCWNAWVTCSGSDTKTWQNQPLNYTVTISTWVLFDYWIEETITVTWIVCDRTGQYKTNPVDGNCYVWFSRTFNNPIAATWEVLSPGVPDISDRNVLLNPEIVIRLTDDWAGVNTWSVKLIFKLYTWWNWINLTTLSGSDFTWWMFSGTEISYELKFNVKSMESLSWWLPEESKIKIEWTVADKNGYQWNIQWVSFDTMPSCDKLQCCEWTEIYIATWWNYVKVEDFTWTSLTVSWHAWWSVDEDWTWIITCQTSGLSLYDVRWGTNTFTWFTDLSEIDIEGTWIKIEISGDQMILWYLKDDLVIRQISPAVGTTWTSRTVSLNWTLNDMDSYDWISGFVVTIYTWWNPDNLVDSWFVSYVEWKNITGYLDTLDDGSDYYWSVYLVDKAWRTWWIVSTWAFAVEVKYLVGAMTITQIYPTWDVNTGIIDFLWSTWWQIDNTMVWEFSGFIVSVYSWSDVLWTWWTDTTWWTNTTWLENWTYVWKVSAVDNEWRVGTEVSQSFNVQLEKTYTVKVYPGGRETCTANCIYGNQHSWYIRIFTLSWLSTYSWYVSLSWLSYSWLNLPDGMYEIETNVFEDWDLILFKYVNPWIYVEYTWYIMNDKNNNVLVNDFVTGKYVLHNNTDWKIIFENFDWVTESDEVYSWRIDISLWWTWLFTWMIPNGDYIVFYKWESRLSSFITDFNISNSVTWFDFTTWDNLYNVYYKLWVWYQIPWDIYDAAWNINSYVDVDDVWYIVSIIWDYPGVAVLATSWMKLNLDWDKTVWVFDIWVVLDYLPNLVWSTFMPYYDPFLKNANGFYVKDWFMNNIIWKDWILD